MPTSGGAIQSGPAVMDTGGFWTLPPHQLHCSNPFAQAPPSPQAYAPSTFVHQDTVYETKEQGGSPFGLWPPDERIASIDSPFYSVAVTAECQSRQLPGVPTHHMLPPSAEKFRFRSTLNAPTAMIKDADEIPVAYLNKGQAYSLSIVDTNPDPIITLGTKYRTSVRISFEADEQRQDPSLYWSLWKEVRGAREAHQRGGKLRAVEYVKAAQPSEGVEKRTRVELERSSFDGFSISWTRGADNIAAINIAVRFNFVSTDFSHTKGVKGSPVRLCAMTSQESLDSSQPANNAKTEICFCKVKIFRDHGAERKLSNDVAHIKKSINKLKSHLAEAENVWKDFGKRSMASGKAKVGDSQRLRKTQKARACFKYSAGSANRGEGPGRLTSEDNLHFELQMLQDMFTSTRPVSVLYLRGEESDDPDAHPVTLPGELSPKTKIGASQEVPNWLARNAPRFNPNLTASPSSDSLFFAAQVPARRQAGQAGQWQNAGAVATVDVPRKCSDQPTKVKKIDEEGKLNGWIVVLDVEPSYRPPSKRMPKPVACFHILHRTKNDPHKRGYYRAVYLWQRSVKELNDRIKAKWGFEPTKIRRVVHQVQSGLEVEMDDDDVRELKEGQDMILEIEKLVEKPSPARREWEMAVDESDTQLPPSDGYFFRLKF